MERTKVSIFSGVDWITAGLYLILVFIGLINIYAANYTEAHPSIFDLSQNSGKQIIWIVTSLLMAFFVLIIDSRFYKQVAFPLYVFGLILLAGVLVFGTEIKGARSWFSFGGFSFQPSEFAKYATALAFSRYLSDADVSLSNIKSRLVLILIIALPAGLILIQPDAGSTLVYAAFIFVMYREGMSGNILLLGFISVVLFVVTLFVKQSFITIPFTSFELNGKYILIIVLGVIGFVSYLIIRNYNKHIWKFLLTGFILMAGFVLSTDYIFDEVFSDRHRNRINELLGIISDPRGTGYNQHQSKIAIGSGGIYGKGFLQGTQTKNDFVPEQSTDFIFCTVGEEWGFIGSFFVVTLFLVLLGRLIFLAERQRSKFARIYGYSVLSILFIHFAINIAMTLGLAPVIGIPLPFFSYGGSSLWSFTLLLFTFVKLDSDRKHVL